MLLIQSPWLYQQNMSTKQNEKFLAKNNEELSLNIQEERIDNVLAARYLGMQVDMNLRPSSYSAL